MKADTDKEGKIVVALAKRGFTLALAESCTGGAIADRITNIPGASKVLVGGSVVYTPEAKMILLGLDQKDIPPGSVSGELSKKMAMAIQSKLNTDFALAITGALGPETPDPTIAVGEVYIAVTDPGDIKLVEFKFTGDRQTIKEEAVCSALGILLETIARW